jgi:hypothetical protein
MFFIFLSFFHTYLLMYLVVWDERGGAETLEEIYQCKNGEGQYTITIPHACTLVLPLFQLIYISIAT